MEESLRQRLVEFMKAKGLSVNSLSKVIGVQTRTLNNQIKTSTSISAATLLEILFHYQELSAEWLLRGVGSMFAKNDGKDIYETIAGQIRDDGETINALRKTISAQDKTICAQDKTIAVLEEQIQMLKRDVVAPQSSAHVG